MKIFKSIILLFLFSCGTNNSENSEAIYTNSFDKDLAKYESIWNSFLAGDTSVINENNFKKDVVVVTTQGDLVGLEAIKGFYMNYLNGFSNIEFTIVDAFGQGNRIVKHWNFKGVHTGDFFGIPATGNTLDLSGTTLVTMENGKIAKEQDFFDMQSLTSQLSKQTEDAVIVDDYTGI
ncbi:MAG: hypothetical protein CMP66_07220 [Flavobacteriales bacterium]|nr:hypothetical protein [Flavobacteriales bacterium]|tara:strand:+ start:175 stop:705 length:531 start_codon:yes stop_codon:yes gene_type:complete